MQNRIIFDLNNRYFDFSSEFNGKEANFDTSNIIWIKWCDRQKIPYEKLNWRHNKIKYEPEKNEILVQHLAELLSEFGDVSVVKDSCVSAYVEFTSFELWDLKRTCKKSEMLKDKKVLEKIREKLENFTGISPFEVYPYEEAEKFHSDYVHE